MSHETHNPFGETPAERLLKALDPSNTQPLEDFLAGFFSGTFASRTDREMIFSLSYREEGVQFTVTLRSHTFHRIVPFCEIHQEVQPEKFGRYLCGQMVEAVVQTAREVSHD